MVYKMACQGRNSLVKTHTRMYDFVMNRVVHFDYPMFGFSARCLDLDGNIFGLLQPL